MERFFVSQLHVGRHRSSGYSAMGEIATIAARTARQPVKASALVVASGGLVAAYAVPATAAPAPATPVAAQPAAAQPVSASAAVPAAFVDSAADAARLGTRHSWRRSSPLGLRGRDRGLGISGSWGSRPNRPPSPPRQKPTRTLTKAVSRSATRSATRSSGSSSSGTKTKPSTPHVTIPAGQRHHRDRRLADRHPVRLRRVEHQRLRLLWLHPVRLPPGRHVDPRTAEGTAAGVAEGVQPAPGDLIFFGFPAYPHHLRRPGQALPRLAAGHLTSLASIWTYSSVSYGRF